MGQVVPQTGGRAVATTSANPWAEAAKGVETGSYLKFNGNDGRWSFGQDDEDLPEGSRAVGDMETLAFGWMCWMESAVEEEILVPVMDGKPPMEHELADHGPYDDDDGWREAASLSLVLESYGDDDQDEAVGTQLLWKTSTGGQVRQLRKVSGAYGRVFSQHPGEFPIIELGAESYVPKNKKHGKIKWSPMLKIVGWMTADELAGLVGEDIGDDEPAPAPKAAKALPAPKDEPAPRRSRAAAPPAEEPEEEDEEEEVAAPPARRGRAAAPAVEPEEEEEEVVAPAPRRGRRAAAEAPAEEEEEVETPAPRRGRRAAAAEAPADDEGDDEPAPAAPARGGRRVRNFT